MSGAAYEHNGKPVAAGRFYAIACDPARSVAVEACAGSGKTWLLVSRIVRALLDGTQPQDILAITFTKRAAGEMRERLHQWLSEFAQADDEDLAAQLAMRGWAAGANARPQATIEKLRGLYRAVLAGGRPVQIRTFHSWFAALLRGAPLALLQRLELPAAYELLEDDTPAKALVWRRFYAALSAMPERKADFEAVVHAHGRFQARRALEAALDKRIEFALADGAGVVDGGVVHFARQFPECADLALPEELLHGPASNRQLLMQAAAALATGAPSFAAKGVELEQAVSGGEVDGIFAALLTDKGEPRKFSEKIRGLEHVRAAQELVLRVAAARQQHAAWEHQQRMGRLSRVLIAEFAALKRERGWVDMNDVERAALRMLGDEVVSGWVQERLDARVRHLLIDEFQDTNALQWQALFSWLRSYAGAGRAPALFVVGDPKQSIYRFRRAEPQVFRAAQKFIVDELGGDLLTCDHTRRNAQAVIGVVNAAMGAACTDDGYEGFRPHTTGSAEQGMVGCLPPVPREDEPAQAPGELAGWRDSLDTPRELPEDSLHLKEARQAAAWVAGLLAQGVAPEQVMVLSRRRAGLLPLYDALRDLRIPAQIGEKTGLMECVEVQDVVALLDVLVSTQHDLSLARALRSPLFGLDDDALVRIALLRRALPLPWFELLGHADAGVPALGDIAATLARWKRWLDALPPHDALQAIYDDGDVLARFAAAAPAALRGTVLANLRALLSASLAIDAARYATPYAFVRALKSGTVQAPPAVSDNAVRLLTIHGAKGLEADAVLLLDTDTPQRNADTMTVLVDWPGGEEAPRKFVFLASEKNPPACAAAALADERAAREREELNALYVALTRARQTLVASSIEPHREAGRSWWQRLQPLMPALHVPPPGTRNEAAAALPAEFSLPVLPKAPRQELVAAQDEPAREEDSPESRVGQAMHRLLQWGGPQPGQLAPVAREFRLTPAQGAQAAAMAGRILQGAGAWAWDDDAVSWQGDEVELVHAGQTLRLDRVVRRRDTGEWWVLDYKSAARPQADAALVDKMRLYRTAVQAAHGGAAVRAAFLTARGEVVVVP